MRPILSTGDWSQVPRRLRRYIQSLARKGQVPLGPGRHRGGIVWRRAIPGYLLIIEIWSEGCLEEGLFAEDAWEERGGDDIEFDWEWLDIPGSFEGRLYAYQEEANQRRLRIERGPDAPPPGGTFVWEGWWRTEDRGTNYEAANMVVWKMR